MIIPVRCMTCSAVLANQWKYYETESKKLEEAAKTSDGTSKDSHYKNFEGVSKKELLDKMGIKKICCRRHFLTHVDMTEYI